MTTVELRFEQPTATAATVRALREDIRDVAKQHNVENLRVAIDGTVIGDVSRPFPASALFRFEDELTDRTGVVFEFVTAETLGQEDHPPEWDEAEDL